MKKSNVIIITVLAIISVFLLWLWFHLGFNHVDTPLDLVLSIIWWVMLLVGVLFIRKVEKTRREKMRTIYLGNGVLFNSEAGLVNTSGYASQIEAIQEVLTNMEYGFHMEETPKRDVLPMDCAIRTVKFKDEGEDEEPTWEGNVVFANDDDAREYEFGSREELARILASA